MTISFENPFADYGNIVGGQRFIGRQESLKVLESRVIRPQEPGNLAIIGEPRIGKSSLVYKAVIERKNELIAKKLLPIWINLGTYDQSAIFLRIPLIEPFLFRIICFRLNFISITALHTNIHILLMRL